MTARKQHPSDLERRRINSINTVVFDKPAVAKVHNSNQPNGYKTPVWNVRAGADAHLDCKSLGGSV